ncbi:hypothetical protein TUN199_10570 [Pyrenophora tritici-repentis]|nr:hypothetical protein Alg130_10039 [Pyrenophora tritici-repentis]KAI0605762.1 hypothetical protein TUN205_09993 [Pyrenophora tritici-repentis]KAI0617437.1 hypothetical protein TUN199_10570 [Pyrenophora tritici-repentis]
MTSEFILKSFQATGVWPMEADAVLKRFNNHPQPHDEDAEIGEHGDGDSWPELRKILDAAVADKARIESKRLSRSIHSLQVNNELLHTRNEELEHEPNVIKKRPAQRTTLTTQEGDDWHGGAVFYSPRKLASERARAKLQNLTKPRSYNFKKLAIERQGRRQQHTTSSRKKMQRWLDSVLRRSVARRREHKLQRWLPNERSKSSKTTLQPLQNLTIHQQDASEQPHTKQLKFQTSVVVL